MISTKARKMSKWHYIFIIFSVVISACNSTPTQLNIPEYIKWVENPGNSLKKEKTIGDFSYKVFYKPADFIALREAVNTGKQEDKEAIQKRSDEIQNFYQFNFDIVSADGKTSVLKHNITSEAEYGARINYFVSHAQQDFKLVQGNDTLPCISYHFERTYGITPKNTILLGFAKPNTLDDIQLIFTNRLFNTGDIKFQFSKNTLTKIPRLTL